LGIYVELATRQTSRMDEFLIHLPDFHVIVCKKCQYAVLPSQIDAHFMPKKPTRSKKPVKKRHGIGKALCERIKKNVAQINGLIPNPEVLKQCEFPFPPSTATPISALGQPEPNGMRCAAQVGGGECGYICCSLQQIQEHSWAEHQWKSEDKGGRPGKQNPGSAKRVPWQTGIHCQRFFKQGYKSQYFEVQPIPTGASSTPRIASRKSQFEAAKKEIERAFAKAEEEEQRQIKESDEAKEPNPWLRRVGCVGHLAHVDRKQVQTFVAPVNPEKEPGLAILDTVFEWLI
jgi:hypothetical protein